MMLIYKPKKIKEKYLWKIVIANTAGAKNHIWVQIILALKGVTTIFKHIHGRQKSKHTVVFRGKPGAKQLEHMKYT